MEFAFIAAMNIPLLLLAFHAIGTIGKHTKESMHDESRFWRDVTRLTVESMRNGNRLAKGPQGIQGCQGVSGPVLFKGNRNV